MANKAIHQLPFDNNREASDVLYIVRSGVDMQIPASAMAPALQSQTTVIPSADVLTMNDTPVQVVDAAPTGYSNIPIRGLVQFSGGTNNYATNTTMVIGSTSTVSDTDYLASTDIQDRSAPINIVVQTTGKAVIDDGLSAYVTTGNPTAGNSNLTVTVWYYQLEI